MHADKQQFNKWSGGKNYIQQSSLQKIFEKAFDFVVDDKVDVGKYKSGKDGIMGAPETVIATWLTGIDFKSYMPPNPPEGYMPRLLSGDLVIGSFQGVVGEIFKQHGKNGRLYWEDYKKIKEFSRSDVSKSELKKEATLYKNEILARAFAGEPSQSK